jgi:hypothetical protein
MNEEKERVEGQQDAQAETKEPEDEGQEQERWAMLLREAELIATLLKESGTRR